jgi:hypothetical protein
VNGELFTNPLDPLHDRKFCVRKLEAGYVHRIPLVVRVKLAPGGAVGVDASPRAGCGRWPLSAEFQRVRKGVATPPKLS